MNDELNEVGSDVGADARVAAMRRRQGDESNPGTSWIDPGSLLEMLSRVLPDWLTNRSAITQNRQRLEDIDQQIGGGE